MGRPLIVKTARRRRRAADLGLQQHRRRQGPAVDAQRRHRRHRPRVHRRRRHAGRRVRPGPGQRPSARPTASCAMSTAATCWATSGASTSQAKGAPDQAGRAQGRRRRPAAGDRRARAGLLKGRRIVLVGTGRLLDISDFGSTEVQSLLRHRRRRDAGQRPQRPGRSAPTTGRRHAQRRRAVDWAADRGWYLDLPAGDQVNTRPTLAYGAVAFVTNTNGGTDCAASSRLWVIDLLSGGAFGGTDYVSTVISDTANSSGVTALLTADGKIIGSGQDADGKPWQRDITDASTRSRRPRTPGGRFANSDAPPCRDPTRSGTGGLPARAAVRFPFSILHSACPCARRPVCSVPRAPSRALSLTEGEPMNSAAHRAPATLAADPAAGRRRGPRHRRRRAAAEGLGAGQAQRHHRLRRLGLDGPRGHARQQRRRVLGGTTTTARGWTPPGNFYRRIGGFADTQWRRYIYLFPNEAAHRPQPEADMPDGGLCAAADQRTGLPAFVGLQPPVLQPERDLQALGRGRRLPAEHLPRRGAQPPLAATRCTVGPPTSST